MYTSLAFFNVNDAFVFDTWREHAWENEHVMNLLRCMMECQQNQRREEANNYLGVEVFAIRK
jgi:hypothetical protein